jgi:hypothetical protein
MNQSSILFREVQRFRDVWWVMLLVFALAALQWGIVITQLTSGPVGNNPVGNGTALIFALIFGLALPLFFVWLHMVVEVWPEGVLIRYRPFVNRRIPIEQIVYVEPRVYGALREYGGWGIRGFGGRVAYNVSGNAGVELTLADGRRVLIGSQRPAELAEAIYISHSGLRK